MGIPRPSTLSTLILSMAFALAIGPATPASAAPTSSDVPTSSAAPPPSALKDGPARFTVDVGSRKVTLVESWKLKFGDEPAWSLPDYPDSDWAVADEPGAFWALNGLPDKGIVWYRARIRLVSRADSLNPLNMRITHYPTAQEIYWDGILVAANGRVGGTAEEERSGRISQAVRIPYRLTGPGEHLLAFRVSNHFNVSGGLGAVRLGGWKPLQNSIFGQWAMLIFQVGVIGIAGAYFFANFMARINRTYALFSLICLGCVLQTLPLYFALRFNVTFVDNRWFAALQYLGYGIILCSLPLCFLSEFSSMSRKWYWVVAAITASIVLPCECFIFNLIPSSLIRVVKVSNDLVGFAAIAVCLGVTGWAVYRKKENSRLAGLGLLCMLAGVTLGVIYGLTFTWPLGLSALVLFLNTGLSRTLSRRNLAFQEVQLKGARLEIELLKKNIQPHFLLTSLRSITDLLEKDPKVAARLVGALAVELRMMLKMTVERVVSLDEEADLCRTHLEVMGLRRHRTLALDTREVDGDERIPPMIMHTLMEMGLDEAEEDDGDIRFLLERLPGNGLVLRLSHQARLKPRWQRGEDETALKYVRARLQECYPDRWFLHAGLFDAPWSAEIRITDPTALAVCLAKSAASGRAGDRNPDP
ncbi:MAG: regulator [Fibrobacteres bacterium]|nr:regulator [Fibrobacterota bacterium]